MAYTFVVQRERYQITNMGGFDTQPALHIASQENKRSRVFLYTCDGSGKKSMLICQFARILDEHCRILPILVQTGNQ